MMQLERVKKGHSSLVSPTAQKGVRRILSEVKAIDRLHNLQMLCYVRPELENGVHAFRRTCAHHRLWSASKFDKILVEYKETLLKRPALL
jgi:hypothetical protein